MDMSLTGLINSDIISVTNMGVGDPKKTQEDLMLETNFAADHIDMNVKGLLISYLTWMKGSQWVKTWKNTIKLVDIFCK